MIIKQWFAVDRRGTTQISKGKPKARAGEIVGQLIIEIPDAILESSQQGPHTFSPKLVIAREGYVLEKSTQPTIGFIFLPPTV